jgi:hypothetical protein
MVTHSQIVALRKRLVTLFLLLLVVGLGATFTSNARITSYATLKANIPHSFVVNNTTLPPGSYNVRVATNTAT